MQKHEDHMHKFTKPVLEWFIDECNSYVTGSQQSQSAFDFNIISSQVTNEKFISYKFDHVMTFCPLCRTSSILMDMVYVTFHCKACFVARITSMIWIWFSDGT